MYKYIASDKLSGPRSEIESILEDLRERLAEKYNLKSAIMVTGSVKRGLVTVDDTGHFDLDYNIYLTKIPEEVRNNLKGLRDRVRTALDAVTDADYCNGQDSTSVITLGRKDGSYSLDLGILIKNKNGKYCRLVRDNKTGNYQLIEIRQLYNTEMQEEYIQLHQAGEQISDLYLKLKNKQPDRDSFHLYLEVVNTVFNETGGHRMSKVSGNNHTQSQMNAHANQKNSNNSSYRAAANNRANQMNSNNVAYKKSRSNGSK